MLDKSFPKKKNPWIVAILAVIFGPFGYLYIGWRYAVAAVLAFALFILIFHVLLFVPPWLKFVNVFVFAFMAIQISQIRNKIITAGHQDAFAFNTFPVAIFAMTNLLPMLAVIDTIAIGIFRGIQTIAAGELGKGLLLLLLATPFMSFINLFVCSLVASGIDWLVILFAPSASTNIFPTSLGQHKRDR
jgi:hypothetical protein